MLAVKIKEADVIHAASEGMDQFISLFSEAIYKAIGGRLDTSNIASLSADQVTLLAYLILRDEVMDGGFIQLIHNGYGPFIYQNPFQKMLKAWEMHGLAKVIGNTHKLYDKYKTELTAPCEDDEFMALFEKFPQFDDYDDLFVENEEDWTAQVAHYIDQHINDFALIEK